MKKLWGKLNKKVLIILTVMIAGGCVMAGSYSNGELNLVHTAEMKSHMYPNFVFLLKDGRVLIIESKNGYGPYFSSIEIYDPKTNKVSLSGNLNQWRYDSYVATLLHNDKILVTGGMGDHGENLASAEIFDPSTGKSEYTENMNFPRSEHTATLLNDGKVLIIGDDKNADLYDPATGKFTIAGKMVHPRSRHAAILLNNGNVLVAGGSARGLPIEKDYSAKAELYITKEDKFVPISNMNINRGFLRLLKLKDGKILVYDGANNIHSYIRNLEIYDPNVNKFSLSGDMNEDRSGYSAILLPNAKVLIIGGYTGFGTSSRRLKSVERFDSTTGRFEFIGNLKDIPSDVNSLLLQDGSILIVSSGKIDIYKIIEKIGG